MNALTFENLTSARKVLSQKEIRSLLQKAQTVAGEFRQKEAELIEILQKLDHCKVYRATGYNSLFQYCVEALQLTEHQAYQYITVARKCTEIPELMVALEDRRITVSKARRMSSVISKENQKNWIKLAEKTSQKELERAVWKQDPKSFVFDRIQYINFEEAKLEAILSDEVVEKLNRVKELLTEKKGQSLKINQILDEVCTAYLEKNDPIAKAKKALARKKSKITSSPQLVKIDNQVAGVQKEKWVSQLGENRVSFGIENVEFREHQPKKRLNSDHIRKSLSMELKHKIYYRDQGRCRYHRNGKRCERMNFLEIHHKTPISRGGRDELENLVLLCSDHHKSIHSNA